MSIVDSHCHLHFSRISHLLDSIIKDSKSNQIKYFVCNATNTNDWEEVLALSNSNNSILPCIGVHPYFANTITTEELKPQLSSILQQYPSCNVGEIGLDKSSRGKVVPIAQQEVLFRLQLQLAKEYNRIPMIHCVRCYGKVLEILRDELSEPTKFLMHGFNGPFNMIRDFVRLGGYISINASLFNVCKEYTVSKFPCMIRREDRRKVLDSIPNDRLLVETDSPDMILSSLQDTCLRDNDNHYVNEPKYIINIIDELVRYKKISKEDLISQLYKNSAEFFGFSPKEES